MDLNNIIKTMLPEFKLSAYERCKWWGLEEWCFALSKRFYLRENWRFACEEGKNGLVPSKLIEDNKMAALELFSTPLGGKSVSFSTRSCISPIRDQTVADFFEGHSCFIDPAYEYWANRFELSGLLVDGNTSLYQHDELDAELTDMARNGAEVCPKKASWEMHKEISGFTGPLFIAVDLSASDDVLQQEFKFWLENIRKVAGVLKIKRTFSDSDFESWHDQKLLPYLDIAYWAMIHNKKFTIPDYSNALFKGLSNRDFEGTVKNTTRPNASKIISREYVSALRLQIARSSYHRDISAI